MSKLIKITVCLLLCTLFFSCIKSEKKVSSIHEQQETTDNKTEIINEDICVIHNIKMQKQDVGVIYGLPDYSSYFFSDDYEAARASHFPNCDDGELGGCVVGTCGFSFEKYVCEKCNEYRDEWKKKNLENYKSK